MRRGSLRLQPSVSSTEMMMHVQQLSLDAPCVKKQGPKKPEVGHSPELKGNSKVCDNAGKLRTHSSHLLLALTERSSASRSAHPWCSQPCVALSSLLPVLPAHPPCYTEAFVAAWAVDCLQVVLAWIKHKHSWPAGQPALARMALGPGMSLQIARVAAVGCWCWK